jgi:hypothetical protein
MSDCKEYEGITRKKLADLRKELASQGVNVPEGDDVAIKAPFGVELQAIYDEQNETLKICINDKPFYVPKSQIWKLVDAGADSYKNK